MVWVELEMGPPPRDEFWVFKYYKISKTRKELHNLCTDVNISTQNDLRGLVF